MVVMTIDELKPFEDKTVVLRLNDGEVARVKILFVDIEHEDIIVDIAETARPDKYRGDISSSAFAILAAELISVEEVSD